MTNVLSGQVVFVTGASSGIGRAIALGAAQAGADVALTYCRNERGARGTADSIAALGRRAVVLQLDVSTAGRVHDAALLATAALGRIDAWINSAGADILTGQGATGTWADKLDLLLQVDLRGTVLASWEAAEQMRTQPQGGTIVNMSWDHVVTGMPGLHAQLFAAAKGGVLAFSKSLARTLAPTVRVNVIAPGWIQTAFGDGLDADARERIAQSVPLGRWGTPEDVAAAAVYLASPGAAYLTGQTVFVGGGAVM